MFLIGGLRMSRGRGGVVAGRVGERMVWSGMGDRV